MSKTICTDAINGAIDVVAKARVRLDEAIAAKGASCPVAFPATAFYLPVIYSFTGRKVGKLGDMLGVLDECDRLLPRPPSDQVWLPYLGDTLDAGVATLFAFEIIEACKVVMGPDPANGIWVGAANDVIMRERGVEFVDGSAPGFAAIVGAAPDSKTAVRIARELQEKSLYVFMAGSGPDGVSFAEQLASEGVQLGWETRLVPFGKDVSAAIYALGFANRAALAFGGVAPGDFERNLKYNKNRIFAFVLALGEVDDEKYAAAAGAINYGFPTIADTDIPQILPTGVCTYEHVVSNVPLDKIVERALEVRGCKIKITKVPIPVSYGPAFEGERIRKQDVHAEFGGNRTQAFEFVTSVGMDAIEDGAIQIIGKDIDQVPEGTALPLAIWVEVAGRKMQSDFEPILERQIHHLLNGAEGVWHMGQRDIVWTRVSKAAFAKGFRLRHYGEILHAKLLADYPAIVDKVKVTLVTDQTEVEARLTRARKTYVDRNKRLESMTDESVDTFYSCLLCQSFAPNHVCMITPERLGLCGAYNWLDGKAAFEIDETGPNQPVLKGRCIDPVRGIWEGINEFVHTNSHKAISSFTAYSIMDSPMTSCGCFESIIAYVPECNGVMIVNREYLGDTPVGMPFSTLAGSVGGGVQTPGFMGVGKAFLTSRKFLYADGGLKRLVWMTSQLKKELGEDLKRRAADLGMPDFLDMVADETVATSPAEIHAFLVAKKHPALDLPDMASLWSTPAETTAPVAPQTQTDGNGHKPVEEKAPVVPVAAPAVVEAAPVVASSAPLDMAGLLDRLKNQVNADNARDVVGALVGILQQTFLAGTPAGAVPAVPTVPGAKPATVAAQPRRYADEKLAEVKSFTIRTDGAGDAMQQVVLGGTSADGGTRRSTITLGGQNAMPFHHFEGTSLRAPALAMEVFDSVSAKCSPALRAVWGDLLTKPAEMARVCVEKHGADAISVRLDATHPEKGNRSPDQALALVQEVLQAVSVPIIVTATNHFESANAVLKKVAAGCAGERLLLNWVEGDNYRPIAGAALAYGHCVVSRSPIDVNMAKQLNILLGNMDLPRDRVVMDPLTGALGYGLEYTYSVMERIRITALGGDKALAFPMLAQPGQEAWKIKEASAPASAFPAWGALEKRAVQWEVQTAMPLILAGADLVILYHPESMAVVRRNVARLSQQSGKGK